MEEGKYKDDCHRFKGNTTLVANDFQYIKPGVNCTY